MVLDMQNSCRICREKFESYRQLKIHFADQHQEDFVKVERWVDETTSKRVRTHAEVAAEGLLGCRER